MCAKSIFLPVVALIMGTSALSAEITFIRPGEIPPNPLEASDMSALDLDAIYRGIDLLGRIRSRASRGMIGTAVMNDFAKDDIDGTPGITVNDRDLAARVEISQARARAAQPWAANDLDNDGIVTRDELLVVARTKTEATARRQRQTRSIELTDEQREALVLDYVATFLGRDLDGDNTVTYAEAIASVDEERILTRIRTEGGALKPIWDVNDDGVINEVEVRLSIERLLDLFDSNGDNVVNNDEVQVSRKALFKARARVGDPSRGKRIKCTLPEVPRTAEVAVLQGNAGSAVTNLKFKIPNDPVVRMTEVFVPKGETDIYLIASLRSPTVLRMMGPGVERVKAVVGVAAQVALAAGNAELANTACHRGFLGIRVVDPGGVAKEFGRALGRDDLRAVVADRLGRVDLGTFTNDPDIRLANDALPVMTGDGQIVIDRFLSFDPGGLQMLDPSRIQSTVQVIARDVPPLEIGLIVLASEGMVEFVAPPPGFLTREIPKGVKREVPKSEANDSIVWQKTPDGGTRATFPLTVVVRRAIELPAGLTTERGVRLIVPDGVPKPRGAKNWRLNGG
ncbi:MAG: hypothetical protein HKN27_16405 [Silicimonas sp.]|nr:hypothetical protein [Silicimonas sp.]